MSFKNVILFLFCNYVLLAAESGQFKSVTGDVKKINIFGINEATWISNAGISKGQYHDRQDLGFILRQNTVLKVRQSNQSSDKLTLRLLGDDSKTENIVYVGSEWTAISGTVPLVPFIDTPYNTNGTVLEYLVKSDKQQKPLPVYKFNGKEKTFFKLWDTNDCEYALIQGKHFQLLLPKKDKSQARQLEDFNSLHELIEHYEDIFDYFNEMAGFDESTPTNRKGDNRYFFKTDTDTSVIAYYSSSWTAFTTDHKNDWLKKVSWGALHEIAHGYQAGFDGWGMETGDVTNNIFGADYQYHIYGDAADEISWLFDFGNKDTVENNLYTKMIEHNGTYHSVDLREKLILLMMLKQKAGNNGFTNIYKGYREKANQAEFNVYEYQLPDLLNHYFSENSKLDFTPVLEKWGLSLQSTQQEINRMKGYPAVASLANVVPKSKLSQARAVIDPQLLITSNFEMVSNTEISFLGLRGTVTIMLKTRNITELKGIKMQIKDGISVVQEQEIKGNSLEFIKLPIGVYTINCVGQAMAYYATKQHYIHVKEARNKVEITFQRLNISSLANHKFHFLGLENDKFGEFTTNLNEGIASFSITSESPHAYYNNETYASVTIRDLHGKNKYEKLIPGENATICSNTIPLVEGDKIEIYHDETHFRLICNNDIIDTSIKSNIWVVTKWGLENVKLNNNALLDFKSKIDKEAMRIIKDETIGLIPLLVRKNLLAAIRSLEDPYQPQLTVPGLAKFGTITIILKTKNITELKGTKIQIIEGIKVLQENEITTKTVTFTELPNGVYKINFSGKAMAYYTVSESYVIVKHHHNKVEISLEKCDISNFASQKISFLGLGNELFGEFTINIYEREAKFKITSQHPHEYYDNQMYASVKVSDSRGYTKYEKIVPGKNAVVSSDSIPLIEGDEIEIFHDETNLRLISNETIINKLNKFNTWVFTKWGLENQQLNNNALFDFMIKINAETKRLVQDAPMSTNSIQEKKLLVGYRSLEGPYQSQLILSGPLGFGTISFILQTSNITEIKGTKIQIKQNAKVLQEKEITDDIVIFTQLPNGIYTVHFVGDAMQYYTATERFIYAKENQNEAEIILVKLNISSLANQKIHFLGLANDKFGEFTTNLNEGIATFSVSSKSPHSYYNNETYVSINVRDSSGIIKYEKIIQGEYAVPSSDSLPLAVGDKIEIYHAETKRRLTSNEKIIDESKKNNAWTVTKWGLENQNLKNSAPLDLMKKIIKEASRLLQDEVTPINPVLEKKNLLLAIRSIQEPFESQAGIFLRHISSLFSGETRDSHPPPPLL